MTEALEETTWHDKTTWSEITKHGDFKNLLLPDRIEKVGLDKVRQVTRDLSYKESLLHMISREGGIDCQPLFSTKIESVNWDVLDNCKCTPLYLACTAQNKDFVKLLLEHGANPNIPNNLGKPSLVTSLECIDSLNFNIEIIHLLIRHGANVNIQFSDWGHQTTLIPFTLKTCYEIHSIEPWVNQRKLSVLQILLEAGADTNFVDEGGENALHLACFHNDQNVALLLVKSGGNYKATNKDGQLPIDKTTDPIIKQNILDCIKEIELR